MSAGLTLDRYIAGRFAVAILIVFATVFGLVYLLDFIELLRRAGDNRNATTLGLAMLALFRVPTVTEQILPFAVLFGSLAAFLNLSRRLELVVARAAGVSVWQFGRPPLLLALGIGLFAMMVYNPVAAILKERADTIEASLLGRAAPAEGRQLWLRQTSVDGTAVIRAGSSANEGQELSSVTVFAYDRQNRFKERIDAESARLEPGLWRLTNARVVTPGIEPAPSQTYLLPTNMTVNEVREAFGNTETVSFWSLPAAIQQLELAGLDSTRYRLKHQGLLARPLLLAAMVAVAASVSLRFFRFGGVAPMVLYGVAAGFLLYVATKVAEDFGAAGVLSPVAAAWLPAIVGLLLGTLALLHLEDG
jgi:lipopolysaccharide export system permease protein